jgi:hypothetical protein
MRFGKREGEKVITKIKKTKEYFEFIIYFP